MKVRVRFLKGPTIRKVRGTNRMLARGLGALLTPIAVMAAVLGIWRLASDLRFTGEFGISSGLFSHWQVWMTAAGFIQWAAFSLTRYGGHDDDGARF
jgi:hypothetical protein